MVFPRRAVTRSPGGKAWILYLCSQRLNSGILTVRFPAGSGEPLEEPSNGIRVVELEGPHRVSPNEIAATFAMLLGHPVKAEAVPRETWESLFKSQGTKNPTPRIQMLDGFNEGWIEFEHGETGSRKGTVGLGAVLRKLIERESASAC